MTTGTAVTATDRGALAAALRALKLSGMLDTLDARLAQARAGELGHLDFLQVLCQDEIARRETLSLSRRLRQARFEQQATLEGFDFAASPKLPAAAIRDLAALRWLHNGESVILYGPVGVGKSRPLILTSNRSPADWYPLFPNPVVAESLLDRLINTSHQVFMNGPATGPTNGQGVSRSPGRGTSRNTRHRPGPGELRERDPGE
jgi:DNA replication protein DnaC